MPAGRIGIFGLAFKEGTDDLRESPVISLVESLVGKGRNLSIFDPHIQLDDIYGSNLNFVVSALPHIGRLLVKSLDDLLKTADGIVIAQKPGPAEWAKLQASGLPLVDLTRLTAKSEPQVAAV